VFESARWRLTFWFSGVVIVILVVIGIAVLLTARTQLFDQVNDDLRERVNRGTLAAVVDRPGNRRLDVGGGAFEQIVTTGGYFYALTEPDGTVRGSTANVDAAGLVGTEDLGRALEGEPIFVDTNSSEGEDLRVYVRSVPVLDAGIPDTFLLQVGRSTEPERQALRQILFIVAGGGIAGVGLAVAGGFFLSGLALKPIRQSVERQRAFVADASHELRTPLTLIRANAELLKRDRDNPAAVDETASDIIGDTDRLSNLVGQMLALARSDADTDAFEMAYVDLAEIALDTARQMKLLAHPKQITIESTANGAVGVHGDETRLRELITILIDNSIKYSDEGSSVKVAVRSSGGRAHLTVSDTGRGIPATALPHIFDRFYRADKARSREMGGTGLGLAIARLIVDAHKGDISIESAEGAGTTVSVQIPVAAD
jgi:two-component system sensor histidine kinase CiaH